ncbi:MAG: hypothetical protein QM669_08525 [Siphonobacter sp.]
MKFCIASLFLLIGSLAWTTRQKQRISPQVTWADTVKTDPETGLVSDGTLPLVKAHCTPCHSSKLIIQNKFTRAGWLGKIRWMQANHKLWELGIYEPIILDYLEKYYGPSKVTFDGRRKPLGKVTWYKLQKN